MTKVIIIGSDTVPDRLIEKAFSGRGNKWRTTKGIAQTIGLPERVVKSHITAHPSQFEKAPFTVAGVPLYSYKGTEAGVSVVEAPLSERVVDRNRQKRLEFARKLRGGDVPVRDVTEV